MIIDQLPSISLPVLGNDEMPVERGQLTFKAKVDDIVNSGSLPTIPRPNLLDNWYFVGGGSQQGGGQFPINQRGQTSYSSSGYTIDRWKLLNAFIAQVASDGLYLSPNGSSNRQYAQYIENYKAFQGETVTVSILVVSNTTSKFSVQVFGQSTDCKADNGATGLFYGTVTLPSTLSDSAVNMRFNTSAESGAIKIAAIKLELGTTQTLAHQENGVWVLNEIPNFADELARCQRYFERLSGQYAVFASGVAVGSSSARLIAKVSPKRATTSNITLNGTIYVAQPGAEGPSGKAATTIGSQACQPNGSLFMAVSDVTGLTGSVPCWFQFRDTTSYLDISADL